MAQPPWTTDERDLAALIRTLAHPDHGGLQMNIWSGKSGFQANVLVKADGNGWAVSTKMNPLDALHEALASKARVLKI